MPTENRMDSGGSPRRVVFTNRWRRELARATLKGGGLSGLIAGGVMGVFFMFQGAWIGFGAFLPFKAIAGMFYGVDALVGGLGIVLVGMAAHLALSAILGVIFASMIRPGTTVATAFAGGLLYGGVVWALMTFVVLPIFNPILSARVALMSGGWFFLNMIFGGALAMTPAMMRDALGQIERQRDESPTIDRAA